MIQNLIDNPKSITESCVEAIYVEFINNPIKTKGEKKAIGNMIPFFEKYYEHKFKYGDVCAQIGIMSGRPIFPLVQIPVWLFAAATAVRSHHTQVAIGYVMNDSAVSYIEEIKYLWAAYNGLLRPGEKFPELVFPIAKLPKEEIVSLIYPELKEHLFWCENAHEETLEQCKIDCEPCKRSPIIAAERTLAQTRLIDLVRTPRVKNANVKMSVTVRPKKKQNPRKKILKQAKQIVKKR